MAFMMADMGAGSSSGGDSRHRSMGSKGLLVFVGIKTGLVPLPVLSIAYLLLRLGSPFLGPLGITNRVSFKRSVCWVLGGLQSLSLIPKRRRSLEVDSQGG